MEYVKGKDIDEYIANSPAAVRPILEKLRQVIHEAAPEAAEAISYGMPAFKMGPALVYFGAFKDHIGFFPTPSGIEAFKKELAPYATTKGTVQLPLGKPMPYGLVKKIVEFRVQEVGSRKK